MIGGDLDCQTNFCRAVWSGRETGRAWPVEMGDQCGLLCPKWTGRKDGGFFGLLSPVGPTAK